ncbi:sigma-70 factor domain-containing protein, partial [Desulfosarcina sp.]|uniref:sigma-70 factor domain-containing protein n=1 Tax=Desulfosarcina sp. TaxID=2027861 RepID=UPI0035677BE7
MKKAKIKKAKPSANKKTYRPGGRTSDKAVVKYDPLQRYLSEISRYNLLTREEEVSLGKRVQEQGDQEAAYRLVTSN